MISPGWPATNWSRCSARSDKGGAKLEPDEANALIMAARERAHWFDEAGAETEPGAEKE